MARRDVADKLRVGQESTVTSPELLLCTSAVRYPFALKP
jgi:hypothetical protein